MSPEEHEELCERCGVACHAAVWVNGQQAVIEDLHCMHYGELPDGTKGCKVYERRHEVAAWCMTVERAAVKGALRLGCPYRKVYGAEHFPGKTRLPAEDYEKIWPLQAHMLLTVRGLDRHFSWAAWTAAAERREPDYRWKFVAYRSRPGGHLVRRKRYPWEKTMGIKRFFEKWLAFFHPVPGWKPRLKAFLGGQTIWEVPGRPELPRLVPWPLQWIPARTAGPGDSDQEQARGFVFLEAKSIESGTDLAIGKGVCCVRCGVSLAESEASMDNGFSPPRCKRCHWVLLVGGLIR